MSQKIGHPGTNFCQTKTKDRESPKKSSFQHIPMLSIKKNTNTCTNNETTEQNRYASAIEGRNNGNIIDISPKNKEFFSNLDVMIRQSRLERQVSESDDDEDDDE